MQRLRSTMTKLEHPRRHQPRSRGGTTSSASSRWKNSPHGDRCDNRSRHSPDLCSSRRRVPRTPDDQQAPRRGDHSSLQPRNLRQQMEYEEYFPRKVETYHRSGPPTTGYCRVRSPGNVNPSFPQRRRQEVITGCRAFLPDLRAVRCPPQFRPVNMDKFDGS